MDLDFELPTNDVCRMLKENGHQVYVDIGTNYDTGLKYFIICDNKNTVNFNFNHNICSVEEIINNPQETIKKIKIIDKITARTRVQKIIDAYQNSSRELIDNTFMEVVDYWMKNFEESKNNHIKIGLDRTESFIKVKGNISDNSILHQIPYEITFISDTESTDSDE